MINMYLYLISLLYNEMAQVEEPFPWKYKNHIIIAMAAGDLHSVIFQIFQHC